MFLVDSSNDVRLFAIQPGEFLDFDILEQSFGVTEFSIECVTSGPVGSTVLRDNYGTETFDDSPPFILAGDFAGDFFVTNFRRNPGEWRVSCQPFCEANGNGQNAGLETAISFVVGPLDVAPTQAPFVTAPPTVAPTGRQIVAPTPSPVPQTRPPTSPPIAQTVFPTASPTLQPTRIPTSLPTAMPTVSPTALPTSSTQSPTLDCDNCQTGCIFVTGFTLVDTTTRETIRFIDEGETLQVSTNDAFAIECITSPEPFETDPFEIGSAFLRDNHEVFNNRQNRAPFILAGKFE